MFCFFFIYLSFSKFWFLGQYVLHQICSVKCLKVQWKWNDYLLIKVNSVKTGLTSNELHVPRISTVWLCTRYFSLKFMSYPQLWKPWFLFVTVLWLYLCFHVPRYRHTGLILFVSELHAPPIPVHTMVCVWAICPIQTYRNQFDFVSVWGPTSSGYVPGLF